MEEKIPGGEGCPSIFSEMPWKLHIFLFLTECVVLGLMFIRKITLVEGKSIRKYLIRVCFLAILCILMNLELQNYCHLIKEG